MAHAIWPVYSLVFVESEDFYLGLVYCINAFFFVLVLIVSIVAGTYFRRRGIERGWRVKRRESELYDLSRR